MKFSLSKTEKKEEKMENKKKGSLAKEGARRIIDLAETIDIEMWSKLEVGAEVLHRSLDQLNRAQNITLKDFPGWKISFAPEKDSENLSLGYFILSHTGEESNYFLELKKYSDNIARILFKVLEIRPFVDAVIEGIKTIAGDFDEDFNEELEALPEQSQSLAEIAIAKTREAVRLKRWSSGIIRAPYIVLPRFERVILDRSKVEELEKAISHS